MRAIWNIALNQVRVQLSGRAALLGQLIIPIAMMVFLGSAITGSGPTGQVIDVIRSTDPAGDLADDFVVLLRADAKQQVQGQDRYVICDLAKPAEQPAACNLTGLQPGDEAAFSKKRLDNSDILASVSIPPNFSADLRAGKPVSLSVAVQGGFANQQLIQQEVDAVKARLDGAVVAARVVTDKVPHSDADFFNKVYDAARSIWAKEPVQIDESYSTVTGTMAGTGFGQSAPGMGAMSILTGALTLGVLFIQERKQWTLQRLMVMPVSRTQILAGKLLGQYLVGVLVFGVMIGAGTILGVRWGDWAGVIVIVLAYALAVTALGLAIATIIRTSGQGQGLSLLMTMVLAPLGGAWWPLSIAPQWMQAIGRISPIYWSQDAFTKMIFYGARLGDILPSVGVLLLFSVVLFAFGLSRFRYE
jgi:ABC-type multidrug transport system permease subunit